MNLRTGAIILSLLPLLLTLVLALPERMLRQRVADTTLAERQTAIAAGAARDIEDGRIDALVALRGVGLHKPGAEAALRVALLSMRAAIRNLREHAGPGQPAIAAAGRIATNATAVALRFERMDVESRHGRIKALQAVMPPAYYVEIAALQAAVRAFIQSLRVAQANQNASLARLFQISQLLFALEIAGLALTSALLLYFSGRTVRDISRLKDKSDRYRRGETLGAPSSRSDEVGLLDAALHELIAAVEQREGQLERYRLLTEMTPDIMMFIDREDLRILDANTAALNAYGYERSAFIGLSLAALRAPQEPLDAQAVALGETPAGATIHTLHQRRDGSVFPVAVRVRATEIAGRKTFVVTTRDTTEQRRAAQEVAAALEAAVEASRLKSEFVATMSHEIRTPMHGVIGMSELLLETPLSPVQRDYAATLKESAQALLAIIDDILDFSKLEASRIELEAVPFDPADIVSGVVSIATAAAREKGLAVRSHVSPHVPAALRGDPLRLRQILLNLIGNAVKFTGDGSVTVTTSVERDDGRNVALLFAVTDTGIGVEPQARERLFEPFVQGDGSMTRRFGGTGLGLSISRRLTELMGGRIWLAEHDGPGATFCFTAQFEHGTEALPPVAPPAGALRVLVVDDEEATRRTLGALFSRWRMHADSEATAEAAAGRLREAAAAGQAYDVVLLDYILPRRNGLEFAAELRLHPEYGDPACILMTAFDAAGRKAAALAAGCAAYLIKPIDVSELYDALNEIERTRTARALPPEAPARGARILLAEDSNLVRRVARLQLEELGHAVDTVENGAEAVAAAATGAYELILMDMRMPHLDGLSATRAIRAAERLTGEHVIIVALTANALDADRAACTEAGMDDFMTKPLALDRLRETLERWLPPPPA